ncbi:MAG: single-stranded DNA-binding protein [bacterium]
MVLLGRLYVDPVFRHTTSGQAVAWLHVATSKAWKDKNGDWQESTEWHRIVASGKIAESASTNLKKGHIVYIDCRIQTRNRQSKKGVKRYKTELIAQSILFSRKWLNGMTQLVN